jgi:uncharacterized small protein (DUF1192 family)
MDGDDPFAPKSDDPLTLVLRQDIDRLSVDELDARVAALEGEIVRVRARRDYAVNHKASADALFRKN